jgi:hypothetical protein
LLEEDRRVAMLEWLDEPEQGDPPVSVKVGRSVSFCLDLKLPVRIDDRVEEAEGHLIEIEIDAEPFWILAR